MREPGLLTLEELFAISLNEGEAVQNAGNRKTWKILRGEQVAGYFEVLEENRACAPGATPL